MNKLIIIIFQFLSEQISPCRFRDIVEQISKIVQISQIFEIIADTASESEKNIIIIFIQI